MYRRRYVTLFMTAMAALGMIYVFLYNSSAISDTSSTRFPHVGTRRGDDHLHLQRKKEMDHSDRGGVGGGEGGGGVGGEGGGKTMEKEEKEEKDDFSEGGIKDSANIPAPPHAHDGGKADNDGDGGDGGGEETSVGGGIVRMNQEKEKEEEVEKEELEKEEVSKSSQTLTSDNWPVFSKDYYPSAIPPSPFHPKFTIKWDFDSEAFLRRPDVRNGAPKVMTWMVKTRYTPPLPEPVRLRVCPEMPCRLTTNQTFREHSAALLWAGQIMRDPEPPVRPNPDQVFIFHNHEPQTNWVWGSSFRKPAWKSAFNWTMTYRFDSDIVDLYGYMAKRQEPITPPKNYTEILARKTKMAAWLVSHCSTMSKREKFVDMLKKHIPVDTYGGCSKLKCPRAQDDSCISMFSHDYKFFFSLENAFCKDYISEKFFRYMETDTVVVARGSNEYMNHAPPGTFINAADFNSTKELADYLLFLDSHPEEYLKILRAKDAYQALYEDWPIRTKEGKVKYMHYHYEAVAYCDLCKMLWDLPLHRKTVPDIAQWVDKANCYPPDDLV